MIENEDILKQLDGWIASAIRSMSPARRSTLMREISKTIRRENQKRITMQKDPDGTNWKKRKKRKQNRQGRTPSTDKFYTLNYRDASRRSSTRPIKLVKVRGHLVEAIDLQEKKLKTFRKDRVISLIDEKGAVADFSSENFGKIKKKTKMMLGLRHSRRMKAQGNSTEATIGFSGLNAQIAEVHQFGLTDEVEKGGPKANYPIRQLLGINDHDLATIEQLVFKHISDAG
jgi:phage gpG-like protein